VRSEAGLLALVVAVALALRLWNLSFGIPDWYHPDEPLKAPIVLQMAGGDLDPEYFYHPSFMLYASAATLRVMQASGAPHDQQTALRAGRLTVALLGTATVAVTFFLGRTLGGFMTGLVAAALLAVVPLHVVCSHYLKEDVPMALWATACFLAALSIVSRGRRRDYLLTGFLAGVAAGSKYAGLLFVLLPWLAHRERVNAECGMRNAELGGQSGGKSGVRSAKRMLSLGLVASAAGFLLVTPYALIGAPRFLLGLGHESGNVLMGFAGIAVSPQSYLWTYHLRYSILPGLGLLPTVLALVGFGLALRSRDAAARLLTTVVFALYAVFENSPYKPPPNADRYLVPTLPFLCVLAAQCVERLAAQAGVLAGNSSATLRQAQGERKELGDAGPDPLILSASKDERRVSRQLAKDLRLRMRSRAAGWVAVVVAAAAIASPLVDSVRLDQSMSADTRESARRWLIENACDGRRILLEGALSVRGQAVPAYVPELPEKCAATYVYSLARTSVPIDHYDFLVASSFMYQRFFRFASAPEDIREFYRRLFDANRPVVEFIPTYRSYGFHNPTIRIYRGRVMKAEG
jgi:4-amino-4-deoxy-L-arabinose transferase-like glycosyltransferase